jgi:N-acetylglucosamine-6-sulfatase
MNQLSPRTVPSRSRRLRAPLVAGLGLAVLATTGGCMSGSSPSHVGGGPAGRNTAAPSRLVPPGAPTPASSDRPNIITIVTDDMRTDDLRWMPHVRHLVGGQGLDYRNSFSPNPLCAPARSSLLTGRSTHNTGVLNVDGRYDYRRFDDSATVGTALNHAGYNTMFLGKYMNGYGIVRSKVTGKNSFRYVPPGWTDWYGSVQRPPGSGVPSGGTYNYYNVLINHNGTIDGHHKGTYQTVVQGRLARAMVTRYHRSPKPFFLYFAPIAPHFGSPPEKDDPRGVLLPGPGSPEPFKTPARPARVRGIFDGRIQRASGLPLGGGRTQSRAGILKLPRPMRWLPPISTQEKAAMLSVTRQRAEALFVLDQQIGKLVATLKRTGEYDDTVLMFTSDNGYFLGEHQMRQGKIWTHEPSARVPFLVSGPGVPHGVRYDPVTSADVAATVLDLARARAPRPVDGASLVPSFAADRGWRRPVVLESLVSGPELNAAEDHRPPSFSTALTGTGVRTARWAYVRYVDGDAELYDLARDPNELDNVYGRARYAVVQRRLARVWKDYRDCAGASCRAPLPTALQTGPARLAAITRAQERGVAARYGVPTL